MIGHKADLLMFHLRPEVGQLHELERAFDKTTSGFVHHPSLLLSLGDRRSAGTGRPKGPPRTSKTAPMSKPASTRRYRPTSTYVCFYPMSKKREGADNWYTLAATERGELMRAHGRTGRRYAGKVTQIVTGSMGLDDWEWGVTLFSDDPLEFKKLVYEMRFDEVSARFADFGPFYVGRRLLPEDLGRWLGE